MTRDNIAANPLYGRVTRRVQALGWTYLSLEGLVPGRRGIKNIRLLRRLVHMYALEPCMYALTNLNVGFGCVTYAESAVSVSYHRP